MNRRALLTGLGFAQVLLGDPASAQQPGDSTPTAFLLTTDDPNRSPSPFIGNGHLGLVIPALGIGASTSLMAGMYENAPGDVPRIVAGPDWNGITVFDGHGWIEPKTPIGGSVSAYRQVLDMKTGAARTSYHWVNGTRRMSVRVETFISRAQPGLAGIRLDLAPQYQGRLKVRFALTGRRPPRRLALGTLEKATPDWKPDDIWYPGHMQVRHRGVTWAPGGAQLALTFHARRPRHQPAPGCDGQLESGTPGRDGAHRGVGRHGAGRGVLQCDTRKVLQLCATRDLRLQADAIHLPPPARPSGLGFVVMPDWPLTAAAPGNAAGTPISRSRATLTFRRSCAPCCSISSAAPIRAPSSAFRRWDCPARAGYYGHIFWDSDTWMFPSLLVTHPDVAHSLVAFRGRTLPAAQANAKANGFGGAMYPWEADEQGNETTPHFAVQNARSEIHVNGDVALAQWQYFLATGDSTWLARDGYPVLRETADFWVSRSSFDSTDQRYHIRNVVSVSEGLIGVSDDAYTNAVARRNPGDGGRGERSVGPASRLRGGVRWPSSCTCPMTRSASSIGRTRAPRTLSWATSRHSLPIRSGFDER